MEGGTWTVLLLQIRIAVQDSQHSYWLFPYDLWAMKQNLLFICAFVLVSTSLALDVSESVTVTQDIDGPFAYTETPPKSVSNPKPHVVQKRANGKVQAAYFSNWCVLCCLESLHSGLATD